MVTASEGAGKNYNMEGKVPDFFWYETYHSALQTTHTKITTFYNQANEGTRTSSA